MFLDPEIDWLLLLLFAANSSEFWAFFELNLVIEFFERLAKKCLTQFFGLLLVDFCTCASLCRVSKPLTVCTLHFLDQTSLCFFDQCKRSFWMALSEVKYSLHEWCRSGWKVSCAFPEWIDCHLALKLVLDFLFRQSSCTYLLAAECSHAEPPLSVLEFSSLFEMVKAALDSIGSIFWKGPEKWLRKHQLSLILDSFESC